MSDPIRYTSKFLCEAGDSVLGSPHWEHFEGEWVKWDDYARLKAEVERLRASSFVTAIPVEQYERLIEAGDALAREICILGPVDDKEMKAIEAWNAAKEGKQS